MINFKAKILLINIDRQTNFITRRLGEKLKLPFIIEKVLAGTFSNFQYMNLFYYKQIKQQLRTHPLLVFPADIFFLINSKFFYPYLNELRNLFLPIIGITDLSIFGIDYPLIGSTDSIKTIYFYSIIFLKIYRWFTIRRVK